MPRFRRSSRPALCAAFLCLLTPWAALPTLAADKPATSPATPAAAGPKLVIVSAVYGDLDGGKTADVTAKVAAMVKDDALNVEVNKASFGELAGAKARKLKVAYTIDGVYRTKTVDEGETLDISPRLFIIKAVYGALPDGPTSDVTEIVADLVRKNRLSVEASNDQLGGDPAPNVVKKLRVDYTFDGVSHSKTVGENQTLTVPGKPEKGEKPK
jgi:hypothetical protein